MFNKVGEQSPATKRKVMKTFNLKKYEANYNNGNPAVYVGTYYKYNCGSIFGMWLDITAFKDYEEFVAVCKYLHRDEKEPEFMYQDFECFPREWYSEGYLSRKKFDLIKEYAEMPEDDKEAFECYVNYKGSADEEIFEDFREAYMGSWDSEEEFAEHFAEECDMLHEVPENLQYYFDWEAYARDLFMCDFYFDSGHVFSCH